MSKSFSHRRLVCRLCENKNVHEVIKLTPTPPANAFVTKAQSESLQETFPLDVFFCEDCAHVQLLDVLNPDYLFENYVYVSGTSPVFVEHFEDYANTILDRFVENGSGKLVVDIGSNDGTLLSKFKKHGLRVLGIDPAREIAASAEARGIETMVAFFTSQLAREIRKSFGPAQIICANNVYAHADDLIDITRGVRFLLADDGIFVFEVSYLLDVIEKTLFDTIYHEHLAYHTIGPLKRFFYRHGMKIISVERVKSHGGSLRGIVQRIEGHLEPDGSVEELEALETEMGLYKKKTFKIFSDKISDCKQELVAYLKHLKSSGKSIAAFGAPAKATTLMYHFGIGSDTIDFIVDDNPRKQGLYSPGMHIPVLGSNELYERNLDTVIILAWNFSSSIMKNHQSFLEQGGEFLIPLPRVKSFKSLI